MAADNNQRTNLVQTIRHVLKLYRKARELKKQVNTAQSEITRRVEENSVPDINAFITAFKETPSSCVMVVYDYDYAVPVLVSSGQSEFYCPRYKPDHSCDKTTCPYKQKNEKLFSKLNEYQTIRQEIQSGFTKKRIKG